MKLSDLLRSRGHKPDWYVVNKANDWAVLRGPFSYDETAGAVRAEMERNASDEQNERWNLAVVCVHEEAEVR